MSAPPSGTRTPRRRDAPRRGVRSWIPRAGARGHHVRPEAVRGSAPCGRPEATSCASSSPASRRRATDYRTGSGMPVQRLYTPEDVADTPSDDIGLPGRFPFTRGPYPTMYRGRAWTMRQIAGFGTGADTNERFRYLIEQGQTGLAVDFDMPTLMGYDSDDPRSLGEVGREGVAIDTLDDMEALFDGHRPRADLGLDDDQPERLDPARDVRGAGRGARLRPRTSCPARCRPTSSRSTWRRRSGSSRSAPRCGIVRDMIVCCAEHLRPLQPHQHQRLPHLGGGGDLGAGGRLHHGERHRLRGGGDGRRAWPSTTFAPRLAFYFVAQADFFEEVAKFRAARRVYARIMKERFGATKAESMRLRFHCQTAAATLTKAQPLNNIVRTALQALSAVLGGAQSLHTNGLDEAYAIPSEEAMKIALRTQQIIAEETRVPQRGGSARRLLLRRGADQPRRGRGPRASWPRWTRWAAPCRPSRRASSSARSPTPPTTSPGARPRASSQ